jgi:hypothetical protein
LVLSSWIGIVSKDHHFLPLISIRFLHGILILACAAAVLRKIWTRVSDHQAAVYPWSVILITLGTSFTLFTLVLAAFRYAHPVSLWGRNISFIAPLLIFGHVALALGLIWTGRLVLRSRYSSPPKLLSDIRKDPPLFRLTKKTSQ